MRYRLPDVIIWTALGLMFLAVFLLGMGLRREDRKPGLEYGDLYFLDGSLMTGENVRKALVDFSDTELRMTVKTKAADVPAVYIWSGKGKLPTYDTALQSWDEDYINRNALYRVSVEKDGDRIVQVSFYQE